MDMQVIDEGDGVSIAVLDGRFDIAGAQEVDLGFSTLAGELPRRSSSTSPRCRSWRRMGVRTLMLSAKTMIRRGAGMAVCGADENVEKVLRLDRFRRNRRPLSRPGFRRRRRDEQEGMSALRPQIRSHNFPAVIGAATEAESWLVDQSAALGLSADLEFAINLCVEELFVNCVLHGQAKWTTITILSAPDGVRVEFVDDGAPFDPTSAPARRIESPTEDFRIGGYGTGLLKKFTRAMSYRREDGRNWTALEFGVAASLTADPEPLPTT